MNNFTLLKSEISIYFDWYFHEYLKWLFTPKKWDLKKFREYIVYFSFINSRSKNNSIEEFNRVLSEKNYKPTFSLHESLEMPSGRNAYIWNSRLVKKICEKNRIVAKSTFFAYKSIDCMEKKSV